MAFRFHPTQQLAFFLKMKIFSLIPSLFHPIHYVKTQPMSKNIYLESPPSEIIFLSLLKLNKNSVLILEGKKILVLINQCEFGLNFV